MRAVVIATGYCPALEEFTQYEPAPLMPVAGRPFLHYVVETLVDLGVTHIDFILSELPDKIECALGDGTRWGITLGFQLARDPARPYRRLSVLNVSDAELITLAHGDRLPLWQWNASQPSAELVLSNGEWTGWGVIPGSLLRRISDDLDEAALFEALAHHIDARSSARVLLSVRTFQDLLEANWSAIEKRFPGLLLAGREANEGIWISRNVSLHPTASITAPVYIGENCRINAGVRLGPRVVVGNNCLVDQSSVLSETAVFPGSYVGQSLDLTNAIVDRNRLVNVKLGANITIADDFILGSFVENQLRRLARHAVARFIGCVLLILLSPFLAAAWLWLKLSSQGPAIHFKTVVKQPCAPGTEYRTYDLISLCSPSEKHRATRGAHELFQHFIPGLLNVAAGHLCLVGIAPRSAEEMDALPTDWKRLCQVATAGLITECYVVYGAAPDEDQRYSAEVFYTATQSAKHDLRLMGAYCGRVLGLTRRAQALESSTGLEE